MSNCFSVRPANLSDLPEVWEIERLSFARDAYPTFLLEKFILDSDSVFLVLTKSHGVIAYCVSKDDGARAHLISLAVLPEHRRSGAASRILKELLVTLHERAIVEVMLEVRTDNVPAIQLYRLFGFTDEKVIQGYYSDGSAALRMRRVME